MVSRESNRAGLAANEYSRLAKHEACKSVQAAAGASAAAWLLCHAVLWIARSCYCWHDNVATHLCKCAASVCHMASLGMLEHVRNTIAEKSVQGSAQHGGGCQHEDTKQGVDIHNA